MEITRRDSDQVSIYAVMAGLTYPLLTLILESRGRTRRSSRQGSSGPSRDAAFSKAAASRPRSSPHRHFSNRPRVIRRTLF